MTQARVWGITLDGIPRDKNGKKEVLVWVRAVRYALSAAKSIKVECPDSGDSSLTLTFDDESKLYIGNPAQQYYAGFTVYE
jgi:hypothetical protein